MQKSGKKGTFRRVGVSHDDMKKGVRGLEGWKDRRLEGYGFIGLWVYNRLENFFLIAKK